MFPLKTSNSAVMLGRGGESILPAFLLRFQSLITVSKIGNFMRNLADASGFNPIEGDINVQDMLQYQKGDEQAFVRIYNRNKKKVYSWAYRMLRNQHVAEEISQEVFLRVSRAKSSYKPEAKFTTWIYTIASRLVFNEIRRKIRHPEKELEPEQWQNMPDVRLDWMNKMENSEQKKLLESSLQKISERQRSALLLRYMSGMSHEEICQVMDLSTQAVKSLLHRALMSLIEVLKQDGVQFDG